MGVTVDSFLAQFPELESAGEALITAKLNEAIQTVGANVWGTLTDIGVAYTCADLIASSPYGNNARLVDKEGHSVYGTRLERYKRTVTAGFRVI